MNEKPPEKNQKGLEACQSRERNENKGGLEPGLMLKPHWPTGLRLLTSKDVTCFIPEGLVVILSREAFEQLFGYAYSTTSEICCLGTVKQQGQRFRIDRFYLVPQSGSAGHTELDQEAVAALVEELMAQGKGEEAHSLRCWAHSHPGMDVFWSKTDEETCKRLVSDYLISLVVSDDFASRCRIDVGGPLPFTIDHVPVLVDMPINPGALKQYAAEVKEKVTYELPVVFAGSGKTSKQTDATVSEFCDTCGAFHVEGKCPLGEEAFDQQGWNKYVRQCKAAGFEPDVEEFEFYGLDDPEFWF